MTSEEAIQSILRAKSELEFLRREMARLQARVLFAEKTLLGTEMLFPPLVGAIIAEEAARACIPVKSIIEHNQKKEVLIARFRAVYRILAEYRDIRTGKLPSLKRVGEWLSDRDHTTILYAKLRGKEIIEREAALTPSIPAVSSPLPCPE